MVARYGEQDLAERFHSFDTICSATQDRQDAVRRLEQEKIGLMIVIGGYNSSNTNNLAKIASSFTPTFHIEDAAAILSADEIRHKPAGTPKETVTRGWFPASVRSIGITAGASTPNNQVGEAIERIAGFRDTMIYSNLPGVH
jgi:4-hydroxy-3-methylbut-2-enyl diphosphate reductase